jgi:hypothetical protein
MIRELIVAVVIALPNYLASPASAQSAAIDVDISAMEPGRPPLGFDFWRTGKGKPGEWVVVKDSSAANGQAIAQTSMDQTDYRFPLAVYEPMPSMKNVDATVHCKPVSGSVDQACGVAVRVTTPDDYYVARANALEDDVRFYRVVKGRREQIARANAKVAKNDWHTLALRAEGDRFTVSFDGKQLYAATDKTFANPGKVALWTKADSVTHFDKITITSLP